jgi:hypothetical protein
MGKVDAGGRPCDLTTVFFESGKHCSRAQLVLRAATSRTTQALPKTNIVERSFAFARDNPPSRTNLASMEHLQNNPNLVVRTDGTAVTEDGLALKNVGRIERFNLRVDSRVEARLLSWQMCRIVRRDFNYIASKIIIRRNDRAGALQVRSMVQDLRTLADELDAETRDFVPNPETEGRIVPVRIVSPEVANVYLAVLQADAAYHRLNYAFQNNQLSESGLTDYTHAFEVSIGGLKLFLNNGGAGKKTAQQLGAEQGIA